METSLKKEISLPHVIKFCCIVEMNVKFIIRERRNSQASLAPQFEKQLD